MYCQYCDEEFSKKECEYEYAPFLPDEPPVYGYRCPECGSDVEPLN